MIRSEDYQIGDISVMNIRNRNEARVTKLIIGVLEEFSGRSHHVLDIQDIYALTLNKLKPRYTQECSIVLHEPVTDEIIKFQLRQSIQQVMDNPIKQIG